VEIVEGEKRRGERAAFLFAQLQCGLMVLAGRRSRRLFFFGGSSQIARAKLHQ